MVSTCFVDIVSVVDWRQRQDLHLPRLMALIEKAHESTGKKVDVVSFASAISPGITFLYSSLATVWVA